VEDCTTCRLDRIVPTLLSQPPQSLPLTLKLSNELGEMDEREIHLPLSHAAKRIGKVTLITKINMLWSETLKNQYVVPNQAKTLDSFILLC
jgi:hypothetical protein